MDIYYTKVKSIQSFGDSSLHQVIRREHCRIATLYSKIASRSPVFAVTVPKILFLVIFSLIQILLFHILINQVSALHTLGLLTCIDL